MKKYKNDVGVKHNSQEPATCSWLDKDSQIVKPHLRLSIQPILCIITCFGKDANTASFNGTIGEADPLQQSKKPIVSL